MTRLFDIEEEAYYAVFSRGTTDGSYAFALDYLRGAIDKGMELSELRAMSRGIGRGLDALNEMEDTGNV
jgi:hypothetical protein